MNKKNFSTEKEISGKLQAVKALPNENVLVKEIANNETVKSVGVVFLKITEDILEYKIRDKNVWNTSELFVKAESEQNGPHIPGMSVRFIVSQ